MLVPIREIAFPEAHEGGKIEIFKSELANELGLILVSCSK